MKIKAALLLIFLNAFLLFAFFPEQPFVSPYIMSGFSMNFSGNYVPFTQELGFSYSYFTGLINELDTVTRVRSTTFSQFRIDPYLTWGYDNSIEISVLSWMPILFPLTFFSPADRFRMNYSILQKNRSDRLFQNLAISLFKGVTAFELDMSAYSPSIRTGQVYLGASFGTRSQTNANTIELFSSPSVNFVRYICSDRVDNSAGSEALVNRETIAKSIEISIPFSQRLINYRTAQNKRRISLTYGFAVAIVLLQDAPDKENLKAEKRIIVTDRYNLRLAEKWLDASRVRVSFFAGTGVHFGSRMRMNIEAGNGERAIDQGIIIQERTIDLETGRVL